MSTATHSSQRKKRTGLLAALVLVLCVALAGGVFAWYSVTAQRTNTFATGNITVPEKKPDPTTPDKPGKEDTTFSGNIQETNWVDNSKIAANSTVAKNPNIGVGEGSDDSYVFVKVDNKLGENTYFTLGDKWAPVSDDQVTKYTGTDAGDKTYVSGIFVYTGGEAQAKVLTSSDTADVYTGELFSEIKANGSFTGVTDDTKTIVIKAYFGAKSNTTETLSYDDIKTQAVTKLNATDW